MKLPAHVRAGLSVAISLTAAAASSGQDATKSPAPDADALRGPKLVQPAAAVATLVHNDASGKLVRLETRPEQVALDVMKLAPDERKSADEVLAARAVAVGKALQDHYDLFLKIQGLRVGNGKPEEIRPLMREFRPLVEDLLVPGLQVQVANALPEARRAEFRTLVEDYKQALAAAEGPNERGGGAGSGTGGGGGRGRGVARREPHGDEVNSPSDSGGAATEPRGKPETVRVPPRVEMNLVLREFGRALKGIVDERKERLDSFLKAIEATPEQESQIRAIARETAEKNRKDGGNGGIGELSQDEKIANWRRILEVLTPEQRRKAMRAQGR